MDERIATPYWVLRIGLGLGALTAGIDKFFDRLADWEMYLSPFATKVIPVSGHTFMRAVGVVEIIVGLAILAGVTRLGGYVLMLWLIGIAVNLITTGMFYDLAVRDVEISLGAFVLARLSALHEPSPVSKQTNFRAKTA